MLNPYAGIRSFLKAEIYQPSKTYDVVVVGAPYDCGTSNHPGARFGPNAIRNASFMLRDGAEPITCVDPMHRLRLADADDIDLPINDTPKSMASIENYLARLPHFVLLGGDHSVTLPALRAIKQRHSDFGLLHFDAHCDCWDLPSNHGTFLREAIQEKLIDPNNVVQIGIRSPVPVDVMDWTRKQGVKVISADDVHLQPPDLDAVIHAARMVLRDRPVYLTFDIDAIDPAFAPGTGTPEIGGLTTAQVKRLLYGLRDLDYIGMDVTEVAPTLDPSPTGLTALTAATIVWWYLCFKAVRHTTR